MRTAALTGAFLLAATTTFAAEPSDGPVWRSLQLVDDGRVAEGWKHTGYGGFDVVDGTLRTRGDDRGLGVLFFEKEKFGNCEIKVVYRQEDATDNAGVHVRIDDGILNQKQPAPAERNADGTLTDRGAAAMQKASADQVGPWYAVHRGYEIQICDAADPYHRTGAVYSLAEAAAAPKASPADWKTMVVTLDGDRVLVDIDGERISTFDPAASVPERKEWYEPDRKPKRPEAGYIALQNHDPGDVVFFKEVGVRPLAGDQQERTKRP